MLVRSKSRPKQAANAGGRRHRKRAPERDTHRASHHVRSTDPRCQCSKQRTAFFEMIERRFAWQARGTTLLAGASGFYMAYRLNLWSGFFTTENWWLNAMVALWLLFTSVLFIIEPLFLNRWFEACARHAPESTFALLQRFHRILLLLSLVTIVGAVAGSHGLSFSR